MKYDIILAGVGGQGVLSLAAIIADMKYLKRRKKSCCEFATA